MLFGLTCALCSYYFDFLASYVHLNYIPWEEQIRYDNRTECSATVPFRVLDMTIKNWVRLFLRVYQTMYVHSFAFHVPEFTEKYGTICKFTQQGLEKLNDQTTQHIIAKSNIVNFESSQVLIYHFYWVDVLSLVFTATISVSLGSL